MKNNRRNKEHTNRNTDNTEETQRKITRKKKSIGKHDTAFLNFFINIRKHKSPTTKALSS